MQVMKVLEDSQSSPQGGRVKLPNESVRAKAPPPVAPDFGQPKPPMPPPVTVLSGDYQTACATFHSIEHL
jgi:hypothetical protein